MPGDDVNLTQYLIFEIGTECNLGALHPKCPNRHPGRYGNLPTDQPVSDDLIVAIAEAMYRDYGFTGHIGWHLYNEPLCQADRMWRLMDMVDARVPRATYTLWTNGTLLPDDCSQFARFAKVHVTDYMLPERPIRNLAAMVAAVPVQNIQLQHFTLDDRLNAIGDEVVKGPGCNRMFTEFIVDYWGNVHLCCYDWAGSGSVGNVQDEGLEVCLERWAEVRRRVSGKSIFLDAPETCLKCKMRSQGVSDFIPRIGYAAFASLLEADSVVISINSAPKVPIDTV